MSSPDNARKTLARHQAGDRLFVRCEGGPCLSRLVSFPPPLEIEERGGMYVLDDDGSQAEWRYFFVPSGS